jgi:hypothetical protein
MVILKSMHFERHLQQHSTAIKTFTFNTKLAALVFNTLDFDPCYYKFNTLTIMKLVWRYILVQYKSLPTKNKTCKFSQVISCKARGHPRRPFRRIMTRQPFTQELPRDVTMSIHLSKSKHFEESGLHIHWWNVRGRAKYRIQVAERVGKITMSYTHQQWNTPCIKQDLRMVNYGK